MVKDNGSGQPVIAANVVAYANGKFVKGTTTDLEGYYSILLDAGSYEIRFSYTNYRVDTVVGVRLNSDQVLLLNSSLVPLIMEEVEVKTNRREWDYIMSKTEDIFMLNSAEIDNAPLSAIDLAGITPGMFQADYGEPLIFRGSRPEATLYMVDGMRIIGEPNLPQGAIDEMQVISGGMPAKYGDATGGVIVINTKSYRFY
jgi:hypothetical protein